MLSGLFAITPGGVGQTQARNIATLRSYAASSDIAAFSITQDSIMTIWNVVLGVIVMAWASASARSGGCFPPRAGARDFHCPRHTKHTIVGAGNSPSLVLAVGARKGNATYPYDETAARYRAGLESETQHPRDAYARYGEPKTVPAPEL
jgi:hypothetical protein